MPRRYRIQWPVKGGGIPHLECSGEEFARDNDDAPDLVAECAALTLGQSVRTGGGAAPVVTITCIEEA